MDQHFHRRNPAGRSSWGGPQADDGLPTAQNDPRRRLSPVLGHLPDTLTPDWSVAWAAGPVAYAETIFIADPVDSNGAWRPNINGEFE